MLDPGQNPVLAGMVGQGARGGFADRVLRHARESW
jgi:hypothetical protein